VHLPTLVGNPAAVVLLPPGEWPPDATLLRSAAELNLSETAFLQAVVDESTPAAAAAGGEAAFATCAAFNLRWFSPKKEVAMCGHGTLAAAHALFSWRGNPAARLSFFTLSGELVVSREAAGAGAGAVGPPTTRVRMCFPAMPPAPRDLAEPLVAALAAALLGAAAARRVAVLSAQYSADARKLLLVCAPGSGAAIAALAPSMAALLAVPQGGEGAPVEGVALTARAVAGDELAGGLLPHFVQRYWSPWNLPAGEDPVNGSSHTLLAPFWAAELGAPPGAPLVSRGLSPRGGVLRVSALAGGGEGGRDAVAIEGEAATWAEGRMWV
jgi:predicted PhzF superfamily epimerase YddE/YHI9